jgi:hypothetical protein
MRNGSTGLRRFAGSRHGDEGPRAGSKWTAREAPKEPAESAVLQLPVMWLAGRDVIVRAADSLIG